MGTPAPYVLNPDQGDALWFLGSLVTLKATGAQTSGNLTVAEFVNPPGFAPPAPAPCRGRDVLRP